MHPHPPAAPDAGPVPYARVSVLAPRGRVDVALPGDVPVGELVPMVLELVGEPRGGPARPWRLSGATGGPLPAAATLDELGVLDGELLRLAPDAPPPPPPAFDDPVDAVAAGAGEGGRETGPAAAAVLGLVAAAALLLAATGSAPGAGGWGTAAVAATVLGALAALGGAHAAGRPGADGGRPADGATGGPGREGTAAGPDAAVLCALAAVPLAAAAGWTAGPGAPPAARVLLAVAAAGAAAALGLVLLRAVVPVLVAVVVAAVPVGVAAAVHLRLAVPVPALAAALVAVAVVAGPGLPRIAVRLAGLPLPVVPTDAADLAAAPADDPPADELAARAALARAHLAGLVGGVSVPAALAAPVAAAGGGWTGPVLAVLAVAVLGLRARGFADPGPRRTLLLATAAAGLLVAAVVALDGGPAARIGVAAAVLGVGGTVAALDRPAGSGPLGSPVARRAVDVVEGVLVALSVPVALGAMGLYELVRGL